MDYGGLDLAYQFDNLSLTLSEHSIKKLMKQLLGGLAYLHQQGILHRDLKLSNILYDDGEVLKICDFGLAKQKDQVMTKGVVTLWYRAPELLLGSKGYTEAVDMWAVGCIFAELLNGGHPVMPGKSEAGQFQMICKLIGPPSTRLWPGFADVVTKFSVPANQHNTLNVLFSKYSQRCIDFLNQLLVWDPAKRLTAAEALLSSYLNY